MQKQTFEHLFEKFKSGQCTPEEKTLLYQWYNELSNSPLPKLDKVDLEQLASESWESIQQQTKKPMRIRLWQAAAAALIISGISTVIYFNIGNPEPSKQVQDFTAANTQHIIHDNNHAQLHLPNGNILSLDQEEDIAHYTALNGQTNATSQELTVSTPRGTSYSLTLPDGSTALLGPLSKISFPSAFSGYKRQVEIQGDVYFHITKLQINNSTRPQEFEVISGKQLISVLGTKFSVQYHPEESHILTTLEEGSVQVQSMEMPSKQSHVLKPGEQSSYSVAGINVYPIDLDIALAWKNGEFAFSNQSLEKLVQQISHWYDVDFEWLNANNKKEIFEGYFPKGKSITTVLQAIENTGKVKFKIKDRTIYIY